MNYRPGWYQRLLETRPETVADALLQFAVSELRSGRDPSTAPLWGLAHDGAYSRVAQQASLPLLEAFPARCSLAQLWSLDSLLWAAFQHASRTQLRDTIERKLAVPGMNVAQRARWLAAGVIVSPETHLEALEAFAKAGRKQQRVLQLAAFFHPEDRLSGLSEKLGEQLETPVAEFLIHLVGASTRPDEWPNGNVAPTMQASELVRAHIQRLANLPTREASDALDRLSADPALPRWCDVLSQARDSQQVIRRDANYRHPSIEQVCQTLAGGTPANAADLKALVTDRLEEIAQQNRTGNTDDWCQY